MTPEQARSLVEMLRLKELMLVQLETRTTELEQIVDLHKKLEQQYRQMLSLYKEIVEKQRAKLDELGKNDDESGFDGWLSDLPDWRGDDEG